MKMVRILAMASSTIGSFSSMTSSRFTATFSAFNSSRRFNSFDFTREAVKVFGGEIIGEPGSLPDIDAKIATCLDPDGWKTVLVDNVDFLKVLQ